MKQFNLFIFFCFLSIISHQMTVTELKSIRTINIGRIKVKQYEKKGIGRLCPVLDVLLCYFKFDDYAYTGYHVNS
jgi:hypothetical protein